MRSYSFNLYASVQSAQLAHRSSTPSLTNPSLARDRLHRVQLKHSLWKFDSSNVKYSPPIIGLKQTSHCLARNLP